jgi:hypothetical protein
VTIQAVVVLDPGRVISLGVEGLGKFKDLSRTERDAIAASLAPVLQNVNNAPGDVHRVGIKGNPPVFHSPLPVKGLLFAPRSVAEKNP